HGRDRGRLADRPPGGTTRLDGPADHPRLVHAAGDERVGENVHSSPAKRGRGTTRSVVEGARDVGGLGRAPSVALRAPPPPLGRGGAFCIRYRSPASSARDSSPIT